MSMSEADARKRTSGSDANGPDEGHVTREQWKSTALAAMANYIDAGSIVAGAAGLALWSSLFHMSHTFVGVLGAFSSNAISAGVGALIGGRICDLLGRKRIYQYDLLVYAFGILWIVFAQTAWMLVVGYVIVGLAVGADVPASWTLIAEDAPAKARGKFSGLAQVFWNAGPVVTLLLSLVFSPLGVLGVRIVFAHLFVVAIVTWSLRQGMAESARWTAQARNAAAPNPPGPAGEQPARAPAAANAVALSSVRTLLSGRNVGALLFLMGMYGIWNLEAGTGGFFFPYILRTVGSQSQAVSVAVQCFGFILSAASVAVIFMPLNDHVNRRVLFGISAAIQVIGYLFFVFFPLTLAIALANVILLNIGGGFGQQPFFQVWSGELFPTMLRSTAQGLMFAVVRIGLGIWSFFVPGLAATGFHTLALILTLMLFVSGVIGVAFTPNTAGKSLEEIQEERGGHRATAEGAR